MVFEIYTVNKPMATSFKPGPRTIKITKVFTILLIVFFAGFATSFLYWKLRKPKLESLNRREIEAERELKDTKNVIAPQNQDTTNTRKEAKKPMPAARTKPNMNKPPQQKKPVIAKTSTGSTTGLYKIISKAYFH